MIIYINSNGEVLNQEYSEIVQGDNKANKIYLIAPLALNTAVNMSFECPNGYVTSNYLMKHSFELKDDLNVWELDVLNIPITQYYGVVKYQFKATINDITIATARGKFKVKEGVDWQLPSEPDENVYADILYALTEVEANLINKVDTNYSDEYQQQNIINNQNGLKLIKTEYGNTTTFEIKGDGIYKNGSKILNATETNSLIEELEDELKGLISNKVSRENSSMGNKSIIYNGGEFVGFGFEGEPNEGKEYPAYKYELFLSQYGIELSHDISDHEANFLRRSIFKVAEDGVTLNGEKVATTQDINSAVEGFPNQIVAEVNNENYVMTVSLKNANGETISSSNVDLPLESVVVNGTYADGILTLTLQNGNTVDINIEDIISGLASEEYVNSAISTVEFRIGNLEDNINTINRAISDKVSKISNSENVGGGSALITNENGVVVLERTSGSTASYINYKVELTSNGVEITSTNNEKTSTVLISEDGVLINGKEAAIKEDIQSTENIQSMIDTSIQNAILDSWEASY